MRFILMIGAASMTLLPLSLAAQTIPAAASKLH